MVYKKILERRAFTKGQRIVNEGDEAYTAFMIQSGKVRIYSLKGNKKIELGMLEPGDIFGETAVVVGGTRTASAEAAEDCNLIVIHRDDFQAKLEKSDPTIRAVVDMLSQRLIQSNAEVLKSKGVNIDSFIALLNQIFRDLLDAMPEEDKDAFKAEAFPVMKDLIKVIEKYRDKL
jgi:CRP-like cAMP-binding protein